MKCFLLAAGLGKRLRPLTETIPKCLLPIGGKPLLQIWLERLHLYGIDEVLVNTHWLHEQVDAFLKNWQEHLPRVVTFYEPNLLGSAGTLYANRHWVSNDESFLIVYSDNLTDVDLNKMLDFHNSHDMPFTLGVFRTERPKECGIAEISDDGIVIDFVEKPEKPTTELAAAGVYIADERIFDFFPKIDFANKNDLTKPLDLGFDVIPMLVGRMKAYLIQE